MKLLGKSVSDKNHRTMERYFQAGLCLVLAISLAGCSGGLESLGAPKKKLTPAQLKADREYFAKHAPPPDRINRPYCQRILTIGDPNDADYQGCKAWW